MKNTTEQAANDARQAGRELGMRADKARTELGKLTENSADKVARLRKDLEQLAASEKRLADAKKNGEDDAKLKLKADADRERAEAQWRAAMEQLELFGFTAIESRETGPVPGWSAPIATLRWLLWQGCRATLMLFDLIETGGLGNAVHTRVYLVSACRPAKP